MLDSIIRFSIRNKLIIGLLTFALIIWGIYSVMRLPIDAVPDITNNQVQVITLSPSLAAQEVERLITFPVEQTMATIPHVSEVRSISRFGLSVVTIVFEDHADIYWARQQVGEKLTEARTIIPSEIGSPEIAPISTGLGEIYQYVVTAKKGYEKKYDAMELRTIQDWIVRRQLLGLKGVAEVNSFGGLVKQYEIVINPDRLKSYQIGIADIFTALERNNQNTGGAYIEKKPNLYFIRTEGFIKSIEDIGLINVKKTASGAPILIQDIAEVRLGNAIRYGALTKDSSGEAVGGIVMMLKGENSNEVVTRVKERVEQIRKSLPEGVEVHAFLDRSALVERAISTVEKNLAEGALIVIFVLVLFLGNLRAGFITASVIPLAMLFAISMMNLFGVSGNLMSLGAIDFGLIVDGAVIVVEATMHHLSYRFSTRNATTLTQKEMDEVVAESAIPIMSSAAFGQVIILIVYLPLLALVGIEGKLFTPMAQTVAFAIFGALILSLTYVPMVSSLLLSKKVQTKKTLSDKFMNGITKIYSPLIQAAVKHRAAVVLSAILLFVGCAFVFLNMGGEFIPTLEEGDFAVETRLMTGTSLTETVKKIEQSSKLLLQQFPEVREVIGKIGAAEIPTDPMPIESCDLMILLKPKKDWVSAVTREELADKMEKALQEVVGVSFGFSQPIQLRFNELISGVRQDVGIKIFGDDLDVLTELAHKTGKIVSAIPGVADLYEEKMTGLPQVIINIDRNAVSRNGLDIQTVNDAVESAFAGKKSGIVYEGEKRFDLVVRASKDKRESVEDIKSLPIIAPSGVSIPLDQLAAVDLKEAPNQIQRENARRRIIVGFNVRGRDVESVVEQLQQQLDKKLKLPSGYFITYGGQFENLREAKKRLSVAVPLSLGLILLLLYFTFRSVKHSLLIFTAIPMAAIGGVFALLIRGMPFSISAGVGFIALFGVAVLNGIVLISEFNRIHKEYPDIKLRDIVLQGTRKRLRPVLMTASVASLGFLPMALSTSAGAEVQQPLATVVIGGLMTSTLLTLFVLPCLYMIFETLSAKWFTKTAPALLVLAAVLLVTDTSIAQLLTLQEALSLAERSNVSIKTAEAETDYFRNIRGASTEIPKTEVQLQYGQYSSINKDNNISITQQIPFPTLFGAKLDLNASQIKASSFRKEAVSSDIRYRVKESYYHLLYLKTLKRLLVAQDSLYSSIAHSASLRFQAGESALLEKTLAETRSLEIKNKIRRNESDIIIARRQLQLYTTSRELQDIAADSLQEPQQFQADTMAILSAPRILAARQDVETAGHLVSVEKNLLLPDFTLGYFSQTLIGTQSVGGVDQYFGCGSRFTGFNVGISIPLWLIPFSSKIEAAQSQRKVSEYQLAQVESEFRTTLRQTIEEFDKNQSSLNYYKQTALPNASLLERQSATAFRSGDIGYVEYLFALQEAISVREDYFTSLSSYIEAVIKLEYLGETTK